MKQNYKLVQYILFCFLSAVFFSTTLSATSETVSSENNSFLSKHEICLNCNTSPVIVCPQNYYGCPTSNYNQLNTGAATATSGEAGCPTPVVTYSDEMMSQGPCNGAVLVKRTWRADYPNSSNPWLFADCTQIIALEDNEDPVFTHVPSNVSVPIGPYCTAAASWAPATATDDCGTPNISYSHASGSAFKAGNTTVTATATDACGNSVSVTFIVTVAGSCCSTAPSISCPSNVSICPSGSMNPSSTGTATASTSCGTASVTYHDQLIQVSNCTNGGIYKRTWTASLQNNPAVSTSCEQTISKDDNVRPTVSSCPSNIVVNSSSTPVTWTNPTFSDNCSSVSVTCSHNSGSTFGVGTTTVTCTGTDACGNSATCSFTVSVNAPSCNSNPVIQCPSTYTTCPGSNYNPQVSGYATASNSAGCSSPSVTYADFLEQTFSCNGKEVHRVWTATDHSNSNLSASCTQIIILRDDHAPTISNCPSNIHVNTAGAVTYGHPTATDNCGTATVTCHPSSGSHFSSGNTTVTCTATDNCGNSSSCSFTVSVSSPTCNTNPVIHCPSTYNACPGSSYTPQIAGSANASNNGAACGSPAVTYHDTTIETFSCNGKKVSRVWTATDPSNSSLSASCTQIIMLKDDTAPTISNCPSNINVSTGAGSVTYGHPTATDNCGTATVTCHPPSGSHFSSGNTTVTCTATDNCGNSSACTFTVSVAAPSCGLVVDCPDDIHVNCNDNSNVCWPLPTYQTCCEACDGNNIPGFLYMGELNGHKYYCSNQPDYWASAKQVCESLGGHLAVINNAEENRFCANFLENQNAWIGYSDKQSEGNFKWCNGEVSNYTNWYPGQPNNYNNAQDCVEMLSSGHWNDQYDNQKLEYICEIPCVTIDQIGGPSCGQISGTGTHTIKYRVTDLCGNTEECSFNVYSDSGMTLECIDDVTIHAPSNANCVKATWNVPQATTCCNNCGGGSNINGFVYMGNHGGSHYYCSTFEATWPQAQAYCAQNGGNLAIINNASENAYLANILTLQSAYIGLSDAASEGNFKWVDGSSTTYTNWYAGQPNNYNNAQDYVEMLKDGQWNDQYNSTPLEFIMEVGGCTQVHQTGGPASGSCLPIGTSTISYRATDGCGNQATCSFKVTVIKDNSGGGSGGGSTCNAYGQSSSHAWIKKVELSNLSNTSGNNGGYKDFTNMCAVVKEGYGYTMKLMPGFPSTASSVYWKVYIDWNRDGDFLDNYEYIANGSGSGQVSGQIPIPHGVPLGETTMRIVMRKGAPPSGPCTPFSYGEVEDYCLRVVQGTSNLSDDSGDNLKPSFNRDIVVGLGDAEVANRELEAVRSVEVYPNPTSEYINIGFGENTIENVEIFTTTGKKVRDVIGQDYKNISVKDLDAGVYLIKVNMLDTESVVQRILVQK